MNKPPPRRFIERGRTRIVQWEVADTGGHFPFLEQPERYASSIRRFAGALEGS